MCSELPSLPTRQPSTPDIATTLRLWQTRESWVTDDPQLLRRLADGLRTMTDENPTDNCRSREPIRGHSHAQQLMAAHAGHTCPRYITAAEYTREPHP